MSNFSTIYNVNSHIVINVGTVSEPIKGMLITQLLHEFLLPFLGIFERFLKTLFSSHFDLLFQQFFVSKATEKMLE